MAQLYGNIDAYFRLMIKLFSFLFFFLAERLGILTDFLVC